MLVGVKFMFSSVPKVREKNQLEHPFTRVWWLVVDLVKLKTNKTI